MSQMDLHLFSGPRRGGLAWSILVDPQGPLLEGYPVLAFTSQTMPNGEHRQEFQLYTPAEAEELGLALQRAAAMARLGGAQ